MAASASLRRADFLRIAKKGKRQVGELVIVHSLPSTHSRLGITVTKRYGNAVQRNRFKRIVRAAYHSVKPEGLDLVIKPRNGAYTATSTTIAAELKKLTD